jgi:4-amino-4-deoxy-L-arabinose transferase-like glycosyltransferase
VQSRCWLEGPQLAAVAVATASWLWAARSQRKALAVAAGLALGYAALVKVTTVLVVPGLVLLAAACRPVGTRSWRPFVVATALALGLAAAVQVPWLAWQWSAVGSPFPRWSGKPVPQLVAENPYVHFVTVVRSPWCYLSLLPRVLWTLVPTLLMAAATLRDPMLRRRGGALLAWCTVVLVAHMVLGATGYAKLLRYVVLVTPATILWFGLLVATMVARAGATRPAAGRGAARVLLALAAVGLALEVAQGFVTPRQERVDLVLPLFGPDR